MQSTPRAPETKSKDRNLQVIDEDGLFNLIDELTAAGKGD
jgi:BRCT domain type II-containing protein